MDVKIRKDKLTGEMHIEYFKVRDKSLFRYTILKNILENETDITILIDTNNRLGNIPVTNCEDFLSQSGLDYSIFPTETYRAKFLGLPIDFSRKKKNEKLIIINIVPEQFTPELFKSCLENYDIGVGIGDRTEFDNYKKENLLNINDVLFNDSIFAKSIYDSIFCMSIRSSFDIEKYISI